MADLDDLVLIRYCCTHDRQTAAPGTVTLNLIACGPSPHAHRSTEEHQSLPFPSVWAHPKPRTPYDILGGLQSNTRSWGFARNANFPRPGGPCCATNQVPAHRQRSCGHIYDKYVYHCPFDSQHMPRKIIRHIAVEVPDTCIASLYQIDKRIFWKSM